MLTKKTRLSPKDRVLSEQDRVLLKSTEQETKKFDSQYASIARLTQLHTNKFATIAANLVIIENYIAQYGQQSIANDTILLLLEEPVYAKNKNAQHIMGRLYLDRPARTEEDKKKGTQALIAAAALNHENATMLLALEYYMEKNFSLALTYFKAPALKDQIVAQGFLGQMYYKGEGVNQDFTVARAYFEQIAKKNQPEALVYLGIMHSMGEGGPVNFMVARQYFERAEAQNNSDGVTYLGRMYYRGQGVEKSVDKARPYFEKAAKQNNSEAQFLLGLMYYRGDGIGQNFELARDYFSKAEHKGNKLAQMLLGNMYFRGEGVLKDHDTAFTLFKAAADQGLAQAQSMIATLYRTKPNKTPEDLQQAIHYYLQAVNQGHYQSIMGLIKCYSESEQLEDAMPWLEYLTQQDNDVARQILQADHLDDNALATLFAQINTVVTNVAIELNLDSESKLKVASPEQMQESAMIGSNSGSAENSSHTFTYAFSIPISEMEISAEELAQKQAQLKAKSAERRTQKAAVALQIVNNESIQLKPKNQTIVEQIFAKKTKLELGDFLKLFADPFFQDSVQVKTTKSGFYIEAKLKDTVEKTGSHHPHGGKEMNLTFLTELGTLLRKYKLGDK